MTTNLWAEYVHQVVREGAEHPGDVPDQMEIARRSKVSQGTVSRWMTGKKIPTDPAGVASFARAFRRNVLEAFVAANMLTVEEAANAISEESRDFLGWLTDRVAKKNAPIPIEPEPSPNPLHKDWDSLAVPSGGLLGRRVDLSSIDVMLVAPDGAVAAVAELKQFSKRLQDHPESSSTDMFIVMAAGYLQQLGVDLPRPVRDARNALVHGMAPGDGVVGEAERLLREAVNKLEVRLPAPDDSTPAPVRETNIRPDWKSAEQREADRLAEQLLQRLAIARQQAEEYERALEELRAGEVANSAG